MHPDGRVRRKRETPLLVLTSLWLALCACHEPESPPVKPEPIDPTNARGVALLHADLIDASIVSDGGRTEDAMPFVLDTGAAELGAFRPAQR